MQSMMIFLLCTLVQLSLTRAASLEKKLQLPEVNVSGSLDVNSEYSTAETKEGPEEFESGVIVSQGEESLDQGYHKLNSTTKNRNINNTNHPAPAGEKLVQIYQPYPVPVIRKIPVHIPHPVPVPVDKPYQVLIPKPYPVHIEKPVPYPVERPVPYPVHVPVKVPLHH